MSRVTVLAWFLGGLFSVTVYGLTPQPSLRQYIVNRWDAVSGLPQNRVDAIAQCANGLIWVNTTDGALGVFDGRRWSRPGRLLSARLAPGRLLNHRDDRLLLVARTGFSAFVSAHRDPENIFRTEQPILAAAETRDGRLWLATSEGLSYWDGAERRPLESPVPLGTIRRLLAASNGDLWIAHGDGLAVLRRNRMEVVTVAGPVTALAEVSGGGILAVSGRRQVFDVNGNRAAAPGWFARLRAVAPRAPVSGVKQDRNGNIWLSLGDDGIARVTGGDVVLFTARDGLPLRRSGSPDDDAGYWIWEDRDGGLWFGLNYAGVVSVRDSPFHTYGAPEGIPDEFLWTVIEDRQGGIWAAADSGLLHLRDGKWAALSKSLKLPQEKARALLESRDGAIWASFSDTVYRLENGRVALRIPVGFRTFSLAEDKAGRIWIAGRKVGILEWNQPRPEVRPVPDLCESARPLHVAADGAVWVGCANGGLAVWRQGQVESLPLEGWRVETFHEDARGVMWVGTGSNGLLRIEDGNMRRFQTREERGADDVHAIVEDRRGYLWLSSNSGLRRVSRQQLDEVAGKRRDRAWFQHFDERAGLRDREFQGGILPAGSLARDGSILMASRAGLVRIDPSFDFGWQPNFGPILDGAEIAGEPAVPDPHGELSFQSTHGRFAVRFAVPTVSTSHAIHYQLAGFDQTWQPAQPGEPVSYTNLPPGRYHFMVRVAPFGGEPSPPHRLLGVNVAAAPLQSRWFLGALALVLAGAGALVASLRSRHIRRQKELLEREVAQRTAQLEMALRTAQDASQRLEREIVGRAEIEQQLIQAQKMESVDRLAGGVAHDFNNLLTIIFANLELAKFSDSLNREQASHLDEIEHATRRAADLTRQLLTFARRQVVELKIVDLNAITAQIAKILRRLVGENVELVIILPPGLHLVRADPGQLEQVLVNLVINARDAMPQGGKLVIETKNLPGGVILAVTDTGIGMDAETAARVFEPFFTTKKAQGGTGLGLAICYGIVRQAGGEIRVYSEPGHGARFEVELPAVEGVVEAEPLPAAALETQGNESILVVEDEDRVRELAAQTLRANGYRVTAAANGDEALRALSAQGWDIDLVIADLVMPLVGGKELARRVSARSPHTRILYVSGYTEDAAFAQHLAETGHAFLAKPFTLVELARKVRETLDRGGRRPLAARAGDG